MIMEEVMMVMEKVQEKQKQKILHAVTEADIYINIFCPQLCHSDAAPAMPVV